MTQCDHYPNCPFTDKADGARICFHCSKNTAKGVWPDPSKLPVVPVVTINMRPIDPQAMANIQAQQRQCRGCGQEGLGGL